MLTKNRTKTTTPAIKPIRLELRVKTCAVAVLSLLLSGCYISDHTYGKHKNNLAKEECEKYGGPWGRKPIVAEGVYETQKTLAQRDLFRRASVYLNNGLQYVEFPGDVVRLSGSYFNRGDAQYKVGREKFEYYRAFLADIGHPLCGPYERGIDTNREVFTETPFVGEHCVAVEGFDDPAKLKAPYEYRETETTYEHDFVQWRAIQVVDRKTEQVIAGYNFFAFCMNGDMVGRDGLVGCYGYTSINYVTCPIDGESIWPEIDSFETTLFKYNQEKKGTDLFSF